MSQVTNIAQQLDNIRRFLSLPGTELELYSYSPSSGLSTLGLIDDGWMSERKSDSDGRFLQIVVADQEGVSELMVRPTHVRIGSLFYKLRGAPERPLETTDWVNVWVIRCDATGNLDA